MPPRNTSPALNLSGIILLGEYASKLWVRAVILFLSFIILIFLFATNAVKLKEKFQPQQSTQPAGEALVKLMEREHVTALDEIKTSLNQMDTWYHYKFILTGGVIAIFLGNIGILGRQTPTSYNASERILETVFMSNRTGAMLTLICLVAFVIDMHIRLNINGIQALGQWIANYVEPSYLNAAGIKNSKFPEQALPETGFIPWETFIRLPRDTNSTIYTISFSIQLHFMTMVSYIIYLMVFQNISLLRGRGKRQQIAFIGFLLVHITLLAFIVVAHTVRDTFYVGCFPLVPLSVCDLSGWQGSTYYIIAWLVLIAINLPYLGRLFLRSNSKKD